MEYLVKGIETLQVSNSTETLQETLIDNTLEEVVSSTTRPSVEEVFSKKNLLGQEILTLAHNIRNRLFTDQDGVSKITWTNGESNLDTEYSALACRFAEEEWRKLRNNKRDFENIEMKASHPDITCCFYLKHDDKEKITFLCPPQKIELKSSMNTSLPGSTSKNLDVSIPIIYCLRPSNKKKCSGSNMFQFECGQYIDSMLERGEYDMFQDRSPRPRISLFSLQKASTKVFKETTFPFTDYIEHLATCALKRIHSSHRKCVKTSWQDTLVENIVKLLLKNVLEKVSNTLSLDDRVDFKKCDIEKMMREVISDVSTLYVQK